LLLFCQEQIAFLRGVRSVLGASPSTSNRALLDTLTSLVAALYGHEDADDDDDVFTPERHRHLPTPGQCGHSTPGQCGHSTPGQTCHGHSPYRHTTAGTAAALSPTHRPSSFSSSSSVGANHNTTAGTAAALALPHRSSSFSSSSSVGGNPNARASARALARELADANALQPAARAPPGHRPPPFGAASSSIDSFAEVCMYVCKDSAAPAHARTRAHRPPG